MNRLTVRYSGIHVGYQNKYNNSVLCSEMTIPQIRECMERLAAYEDTGLEPEKIREILELFCWSQNFNGDFKLFITALKQLKEMVEKYEKLEERGLLIKLPCKVGTELFHVRTEIYADGYSVEHKKVIKEIEFTNHNIFEIKRNWNKTVFLTREEAERALEVE